MEDIILDTNFLADFLAQYFDNSAVNRGSGRFVSRDNVTSTLARRLNSILDRHRFDGISGSIGLVVASAIGFVEIARKWTEIVRRRFSREQMFAFINNPPPWFDLAPLDEDLLPSYGEVPAHVGLESIEWVDGIHGATLCSRGSRALIATSDHLLRTIYHSRLAT